MGSLHQVIELYVFFYTFCELSVLLINILRREAFILRQEALTLRQ